MTQALITINASPGSNADLPIGTLVTLGNVDNGGELTYSWTILEQPPGPANNLSSPTAPSPTFTPTKEGSYLIQLIVNVGLPDERRDTAIAAVLQLRTRTRVPAAGEVDEVSATKGWSLAANDLLRIVDKVRADPMLTVALLAYNALANATVKFSAAGTIMAGLPGESVVPVADLTTGLETAAATGRVGVVVEAVDGGALTIGKLAYVRVGGLVFAPVPALTALGTPIYVSNTGTLSIAPGSIERQVGRLVALSGTAGTIYIDGSGGASAPAPAGGPLFVFNGVDDSQFDTTPDVVGSPVNPQLVVSGGAMSLSMDVGSSVGSQATWFVDTTLVPWAQIRRIRFVFTPTPGVSVTDAFGVGIVAGADRALGTTMAYIVSATEFNAACGNGASPGALLTNIPITLSSVTTIELDLYTNRLDASVFTPNGVPAYAGNVEICGLTPSAVTKNTLFAGSSTGFAGTDWGPAVPEQIGVTLLCPAGVVDPVGVSVNIAAFIIYGE